MNVRHSLAVAEITLDPLHVEAVDAAMVLDRGFAERHPEARSYIRPALRHEACVPGEPCRWPESILVIFWAPGVRSRQEAPR